MRPTARPLLRLKNRVWDYLLERDHLCRTDPQPRLRVEELEARDVPAITFSFDKGLLTLSPAGPGLTGSSGTGCSR